MNNEIWLSAGGIVVAAITYFGTKYSAKQSSEAQKESVRMTEKSIDAEAYARARESYESAIAQYVSEIRRLEERVVSTTSRIASLNEEIQRNEGARRQQRFEIEATVEQMIESRQEFELHLKWCHERLNRLRDRLDNNENITSTDPDLRFEP